MPKNLKHEKWAFNKRAVAREEIIVPDKLTRKRWRSDNDAEDQEQQGAHPVCAEQLDEAWWKFQCGECGTD